MNTLEYWIVGTLSGLPNTAKGVFHHKDTRVTEEIFTAANTGKDESHHFTCKSKEVD